MNFNEKLLPLDKNVQFVSKRGKEWLKLVECINYLVLTGDIQPFQVHKFVDPVVYHRRTTASFI